MKILKKFEVTEQDIRVGTRKDTTCCPVALAMARKLGVPEVHVSGLRYFFRRHDWSATPFFDLPAEVAFFVVDFDRGNHVEPFEFVAECE